MIKKIVVFSISAIFLISLSGCATARKQNDLHIQGLRNQITALEAQIQSKEEEINTLKESLNNATMEKETISSVATKKKVIQEVKSRPKVKQIQIALRNAGYSVGAIDGHLGKQTRDAVRAFQKANNLSVDGKIGQKTWNLLKEYLYKKVK